MQTQPTSTTTHRVKCQFTNRLYLEINEQGISAWCVNCRKPHIYPREQALALLLGTEQDQIQATCQNR